MIKHTYFLLVATVLLSSAFFSCSKDEKEADKEGIELRMRNKDNGGDKIYLLKVDSVMLYVYNDSYQYNSNEIF